MDVQIVTDPRNLGQVAQNATDEVKAKIASALHRTAQVGINIVQDRTKRSVSYKGGAFKAYSAGYAEFRTSIGATLAPNLEVSGNMLGAMTSKANHKQAEIFFRGPEESKKAAFNDKIRPFLGFSREEQNRLARTFERFLG
tara:strand:+ start:767 stop:1189 length:423 start_codon:yes stop_codon:yes gene_type:complete